MPFARGLRVRKRTTTEIYDYGLGQCNSDPHENSADSGHRWIHMIKVGCLLSRMLVLFTSNKYKHVSPRIASGSTNWRRQASTPCLLLVTSCYNARDIELEIFGKKKAHKSTSTSHQENEWTKFRWKGQTSTCWLLLPHFLSGGQYIPKLENVES